MQPRGRWWRRRQQRLLQLPPHPGRVQPPVSGPQSGGEPIGPKRLGPEPDPLRRLSRGGPNVAGPGAGRAREVVNRIGEVEAGTFYVSKSSKATPNGATQTFSHTYLFRLCFSINDQHYAP
ncbi:hypothetical protein KFK09_022506 [Dendrobium nobile]|uniref:Uncharacterized protein n=1 Tax=Dendrobium nobile TaxID=94219 RepID=A0A8T3AIS2_DENNO|nr:hypothetical protein KFK09_022506 [Dendrobium nobile]